MSPEVGTGFGIKTCAKSRPKAHGANLKIAARFRTRLCLERLTGVAVAKILLAMGLDREQFSRNF